MLLWLIVACEIGFWLVLFLGLFVRYIVKAVVLSNLILLCVPLIDLALLIATAIDLHRGTTAEFAHGLAAVYLGFTVVFGHGLIHWFDQYLAFKIAGGDAPEKAPEYGHQRTLYEWKSWLKGVAAGAIAVVLLLAAEMYVNNAEQTQALGEWYSRIVGFLAIWCLCWPLWYTVFPKQEQKEKK